LFLACYQAYKARNISDEFSESKNVGYAVFSWVQVLLVGLPVLFLIDEDNPTARYFLQVALLFVVCMSMLSLIFVPVMVQLHRRRMNGSTQGNVTVSGLPLEQNVSATRATADIPSSITSKSTETAKARASKCLEQIKERNEQPESSWKQIHDGFTEVDSGVDDEELKKRKDSSNAPGLAVSIESETVGI
jgi:hypothetical protein